MTTPEPDPAIDVAGLAVRYGTTTALRDVDVRVARGELCGLVGVNGSGKSTLFKSLMGLVAPDAGRVSLFGLDPLGARRSGRISYVPQSEAVDWTFPVSVRDVVMMGRYGFMGRSRRPRAADRAAVDEALGRVDLADLAHRQIGELSGGQRKRAFVARGLAQNADLMLLDEPFAGVDVASEALVRGLLSALCDSGRTVLISTHDLAGVPRLCTSAILLHRTVLAAGPPGEVLTESNLALAFGTGAREAA